MMPMNSRIHILLQPIHSIHMEGDKFKWAKLYLLFIYTKVPSIKTVKCAYFTVCI